jgi:hypothetical protein
MGANVSAGASPRSTGNSPARRAALLAFIISPLAVVTVLVFLIMQAMKTGPYMSEPPKGAGAGHTGMSNEYSGIGKKPQK